MSKRAIVVVLLAIVHGCSFGEAVESVKTHSPVT